MEESVFQVGQRVKIVSAVGGHSYPRGAEATVARVVGKDEYLLSNVTLGTSEYPDGGRAFGTDLKPVKTDVDRFNTKVAQLKSEIEGVEARLAWMKEAGYTNFNQSEYDNFVAASILTAEGTPVQKAKRLTKANVTLTQPK